MLVHYYSRGRWLTPLHELRGVYSHQEVVLVGGWCYSLLVAQMLPRNADEVNHFEDGQLSRNSIVQHNGCSGKNKDKPVYKIRESPIETPCGGTIPGSSFLLHIRENNNKLHIPDIYTVLIYISLAHSCHSVC